MRRIQAKKHNLEHTISTKHHYRVWCFHDKRSVLNDSIHMLAYFHKDLKEEKKIKNSSHKKRRDSHG